MWYIQYTFGLSTTSGAGPSPVLAYSSSYSYDHEQTGSHNSLTSMHGREETTAYLLLCPYPFLDTLWSYFLTILPCMCVASQIKLHLKGSHQSKALFFSSFWTTWRRSTVSYGSQLLVPRILNGSIFIEHQQFSVLKKNTWSVSSILHITVVIPVI